MNYVNVLIAVWVFLLGLIPLIVMYNRERSLLQFSLAYFSVQHFVFGFGGLVLALSDRGYAYVNAQGSFLWAAGLPRLQLVHLASLYAAMVGVIIGTSIGFHQRKMRSVSDSRKSRQQILQSVKFLLRRVCYLTLFFQMAFTAVSWFGSYYAVGNLAKYLIASFQPILLVAFLLWGLWWADAGRARIVFVIWLLFFGLVQLASGNRGIFVYGLFLFVWGALLVAIGRRKLRFRHVILVMIGLIVVAWLMIASLNLRQIYLSNRTPQSIAEWGSRIIGLFGIGQGAEANADIVPPDQAAFHYATRLVELSTLDVIARTPSPIPYVGWRDDEWLILATNWLPAFLFPNLPSRDDAGALFLRGYGWIIELGPGGTAMPATMLGDAWRRFGLTGVLISHFLLAAFLSWLSMWNSALINRRRFNEFWFVVAACLLVIFAFSYTNDLIGFVTVLPRRFLVIFVYAVLISIGSRLMQKQARRVTTPLVGAFAK